MNTKIEELVAKVANKWTEVEMPSGFINEVGVKEIKEKINDLIGNHYSQKIVDLRIKINSLHLKRDKLKKKERALAGPAIQETISDLHNKLIDMLDKRCGLRNSIINNVEWVWKVPKGGTLTKRLSKRFYKEAKIKLSSKTLTELGNLIAAHTINQSKANIKIAPFDDGEIPWNEGDYCDNGSCFFGCRSHIKYLFNDHPFYGFLVNTTINGFKQSSRSILYMENNDSYKYKGKFYVLFNGYGIQLYEQTRILAFVLGLTYKKVSSGNNGPRNDDLLWINNNRVFIIGKEEVIKDINGYYFDIDESIYTPEVYYCDNCGSDCSEESLCETPDGRNYCEHCFDHLCVVGLWGEPLWESEAVWCNHENGYSHENNVYPIGDNFCSDVYYGRHTNEINLFNKAYEYDSSIDYEDNYTMKELKEIIAGEEKYEELPQT